MLVSQGVSLANHAPSASDPRNHEFFTALDGVARLQPDIFLLENVPGLKVDVQSMNFLTLTCKRLVSLRWVAATAPSPS